MTPEQRVNQTKACHDKVRGSKQPYDGLVKRAIGVQETGELNEAEQEFLQIANANNIKVIPQYAVGIFNIDFAIPSAKIAIEIDGGEWHKYGRKTAIDNRKNVFLKQRGWNVFRFSNRRGIRTVQIDADYAITILKILALNPTING
jgi:very-short-patch-repair endonuclease